MLTFSAPWLRCLSLCDAHVKKIPCCYQGPSFINNEVIILTNTMAVLESPLYQILSHLSSQLVALIHPCTPHIIQHSFCHSLLVANTMSQTRLVSLATETQLPTSAYYSPHNQFDTQTSHLSTLSLYRNISVAPTLAPSDLVQSFKRRLLT